MKINLVKMGVLLILLNTPSICILSCGKTQTILMSESDDNDDNNAAHMEYYSYVADSTGALQTVFPVKQDVFFHFGMINSGDAPQGYTIAHGAPPFVFFEVFKNDSLVGTSDDGYAYVAIIVPGELAPGDTLQYFTSWYSNEYHDSLTVGSYFTRIKSHFYLEDIVPFTCLDSLDFEVISESSTLDLLYDSQLQTVKP